MMHRPGLDGLRGIAVLIVLASHARIAGFALQGGLAGVTLFFVLSGYLITSLLVAERDGTGRVNLRAFYIRRGLRLLPALFALLAVVSVGYAFDAWPSPPGPVVDNLLVSVVAVAGYVGNWAILGFNPGVLGHTWSLGVEEQFYFVWPLMLLAGLRLFGPRGVAVVALALAVLVTPWRFVVAGEDNLIRLRVGTDMHADALLFGCALALLRIRASSLVGWAGVGGLVVLAAVWTSGALGELIFVPLATIASVAALAGCPSLLGGRPLAYVGRISYGLYLWHYLLIWWGWPAPLTIVVSIAVAVVSYERLERPFLRLKDRYGRVTRPLGTMVGDLGRQRSDSELVVASPDVV